MKNIYKVRLLLVAFLMASLGFVTSCDDDDESMGSDQVELLSFGPTGAKHGEKIKFIGYNLDQVMTIQLPGAMVDKSQFTSQSSGMIELVVPTTAEEGQVILKLANGNEIISKTELSFEVPVTVSTVTGEARPGANITLTGNYLNWVDSVKFGTLQTNVIEFVSQSMTELVVTVPMDAKTGTITLYTGGTEPMTMVLEQELVVTLPKVASFSSSSLKHGENLTLTGTNLDLVQEIKFVGVGEAKVSNFISRTPTQIVVVVPNNASTGVLTLVAANSMVEVKTTQTLNIVLPAITTLSPDRVLPGGNLTITGTDLDLVEEVKFTGGASVSTFISKSATQIVLKVPNDALSGVLTFVTQRNYTVNTQKSLVVILDREPYYIYNEALNSAWQLWGGWGKTSEDVGNTERPFRGSKAIKISFNDAYGAFQLHPNNARVLDGYTEVVLRVYGTVDSRAALQVKSSAGTQLSDAPFDIKANEYRTITIPISALGNVSGGITEFYIKNYGTNPNTFYIDDIELK